MARKESSRLCPNCGVVFARVNRRITFCTKKCAVAWRFRNYVARFWSGVKIGAADDCWPWTRTRTPQGYGAFKHQGQGYRSHRFAWILTYGAIPEDLQVCHHCDNPPCCNPKHLFLGTQVDNMADMERKGRAVRHPGSINGSSKLTEPQVAEILEAAGSQQSIADRYGVSQGLISQIKRGVAWKHFQAQYAAQIKNRTSAAVHAIAAPVLTT